MLMTVMTSVVFASEDKVEIGFCIGESTLVINGENVEVEKPYAVGAGVTLVPVRVITEAFGAKVGWINETQTVTLTYPGVDIVLQIGNSIAEVNGKAETLLAAPEISGGSTMVPLRFISENFGAVVSYDNETGRITVIKELSADSESNLEGLVDSKYIGDSYYHWTMEKPVDMQMEQRYFDGTYTLFSYDDNNYISISVYAVDDEYSIDESFTDYKSYFSGLTLVKADKNTANPKYKSIHIQAKEKTGFCDVYEIVTDKYVYSLNGLFENDKADVRDNGIRVLSTFAASYADNGETYDLSNVKNGVRRFEAEDIKLSFDVPQNFIMLSDEDAENSFYFMNIDPDDDDSDISVSVYSKDSVESAETLAKKDYEHNKKFYNEEITHFDDELTKNKYNNIDVYEYNFNVDGSVSDFFTKDAFFEVGDYVYNVCVSIKLPNKDKDKIINSILNSIKADKIDFSKVGTILNPYSESEGTITCDDLNKCTFVLPDNFTELQASKTVVTYSGVGSYFAGMVFMDDEYTATELKKIIKDIQTTQSKMDGVKFIRNASDVTMGKMRYTMMAYRAEEDGEVVYIEMYYALNDGCIYAFQATYPEITYSEAARKEIHNILQSVSFK